MKRIAITAAILIMLCGLACFAQGFQTITARRRASAAAPVPTLIQGPFSGPNDVQTTSPMASTGGGGNYQQNCFSNATQVGDTVILMFVTQSATTNLTVTDDGSSSNTYAIPTGASETAGSQSIGFFVATVAHASHCLRLTFTANTANNDNQMVMWEYANLGVVDKACAATVTSGTSLACSAMTTTVNGDLIIAGSSVVTYSSTPTGFTTYTAQTGTTPTWSLSHADGTSWSASQTATQATAGAITPAITAASAVTRANIAGLAFKPTSAGGTAASNPSIASMQHFDSGNASTWGFSNAGTATTQTMQTPCKGNSLWVLVGNIDSTTVTSVTDNNSNTWAGLTRVDSAGDSFSIQWYHTTNFPATCNATEQITIHYGANPASLVPLWDFFDINAASGYDSSATCGAGSTPCPINTSCASTTTVAGATITPSGYPALILSYQNQDFDTISAVNVGQFLTAVDVCPTVASGCGAAGTAAGGYAYVGNGLEQDAGILSDKLASGSAAITWTVANTQSTNVGPCFSSTVAIK